MKPLPLILDRVEGRVAVFEVGEDLVELPTAVLPPGAREGDAFTLSPTRRSLRAARERIARLRARDTKPDEIDL